MESSNAAKSRVHPTPRTFRFVCDPPELPPGQGTFVHAVTAQPKPFYYMITIPNTIDGAFLLSIIDFILSFVIISGIGVILALFPFVNRFWKIDEAKLRRGGH